jgi:beta-glucuronidase
MPVPSSYNDIVEDEKLRDHVGTVWYERNFFVPKSWQSQRVWVRFGSVHYEAYVWINGILAARHEFGHLPFEADIGDHLKFGKENRITVLCDNVLLQTTIPQGKVVEQDVDYGREVIQQYTFDFFNYAGIHRSVQLYTTPTTYIKEIILNTNVTDDGHGKVAFKIITNDNTTDTNRAKIYIYDRESNLVDTQVANAKMSGEATIRNAKLWWPYLMHPDPAYLYTIEVKLSTREEEDVDIYRMKFGVRTLKWTNTTFTINDKPIYFRGFGRHEDSDVSCKSLFENLFFN